MTSPLWQRIQNASQVLVETPFMLQIDKDHPIYPSVSQENDVPVLLSDVIDLIFKEEDHWVILDYKSDRAEREEDLPKLAAAYSEQIHLYAKVWEAITGSRVGERLLYFVEHHRLYAF